MAVTHVFVGASLSEAPYGAAFLSALRERGIQLVDAEATEPSHVGVGLVAEELNSIAASRRILIGTQTALSGFETLNTPQEFFEWLRAEARKDFE